MKVRLLVTGLILTMACFAVVAQERATAEPSVPQAANLDTQGIKNYLLGPGDVISVRVYGHDDLSALMQVDSEGNLSSLPFIDKPISARCRNEREVQSDIKTAYRRLIVEPQVSVRIVERNSRPPVAVFGAVRQPTRVSIFRSVRLNELIAAAGGPTDRASGSVQILHTEPILCPQPGQEADALPLDGTRLPMQVVKLADLLGGRRESNPIVRPGDYVLVSEAEQVYVTGNVIRPGSQLLTDQLTLSRVLAMSGGTKTEADLSNVRIYRQRPGELTQEVLKVNLLAIKRSREADVLLKPYDVIEVGHPSLLGKGIFLTIFTRAMKLYSPELIQ